MKEKKYLEFRQSYHGSFEKRIAQFGSLGGNMAPQVVGSDPGLQAVR